MRKKLIAGNWKMNGSKSENAALLGALTGNIKSDPQVDMLVLPACIHLGDVNQLLAASPIKLGAQDLSTHAKGAYTGQISSQMLTEYGCEYVLCGHSERRQYGGDSNELVAEKVEVALNSNLIPILCLGECLEDREKGEEQKVVSEQLLAVIERLGIAAFENIIIAYEPVWAIGTGKTATPDEAQAMHAYCREILAEYNGDIAAQVLLLYGGSLKPGNAGDLLAKRDIDGGLIGGASLLAQDFLEIYKAAQNATMGSPQNS